MAARGPKGGGASRRKREPSFQRSDDEDDDGALRPSPRDRAARADYGRGGRGRGRRKRAAASSGGSGGGSPLGFLFRWGLTAAVWGIIVVIALLAYYAHDLPDIRALDAGTRRPMITLLDRSGAPFMTFGDNYGQAVSLKQVPAALPEAIIATEDRRFYDHFGLDPIGIVRALVVNIAHGTVRQGGSTLTQQLAKNLFLTPERTIKRKVQETLLALWLEHRFSKNQILTIYLNRVYLGAGAYGVDAAAHRYFGKPARALTLYECAVIAGLLRAPTRYSPASHPEAAADRAAQVLANMVDAGYIDAAQAKRAESQGMRAERGPEDMGYRFFADWVLRDLGDYIGHTETDLTVRTTFDPALQRLADAHVGAVLEAEGPKRKATQAALVALDPDGAVRAMVGGRDYRDSQFNRATQALRQPGSAFKPFVFLAALEAGIGPDDRFTDAPLKVGNWAPRNFGDRYFGEVSLREAVARSLNSVAVRVSEWVGRRNVIKVARRLGITAPIANDASIALGTSEVSPLELTAAYASFANDGWGVLPYAIVEVRDSRNKVLYKRSGSGTGRVVIEHDVAEMNDLLRSVIGWGTGHSADIGRPAAGKTGTTQDYRDAWFVGYTADLVTGVWVGNDDNAPMKSVTGGTLPAEIWRGFMSDALKGVPARALPGLAGNAASTGAGRPAVAERAE
ncbi:MAG TPA: PBP1A family penicillin-binding protein [Alphaproteobacteria bacterium]|nr:PBP1A family penicillin-binding protein [Alphaproteobacteria bacterium]